MNFSKSLLTSVFGIGLCLGLAAADANLAAAATTTIPGNSCLGQHGNSQPSGVAMHANAGWDQIYCGLPRHNPTGTVTNAYARVYNPPGQTMECWLYSFNSLGSTFDWSSRTTSSSGSQSLGFAVADLDTYNYGYYYVACNVDNGGKIWGIRIGES